MHRCSNCNYVFAEFSFKEFDWSRGTPIEICPKCEANILEYSFHSGSDVFIKKPQKGIFKLINKKQ